jgi:hypothetical protein
MLFWNGEPVRLESVRWEGPLAVAMLLSTSIISKAVGEPTE